MVKQKDVDSLKKQQKVCLEKATYRKKQWEKVNLLFHFFSSFVCIEVYLRQDCSCIPTDKFHI